MAAHHHVTECGDQFALSWIALRQKKGQQHQIFPICFAVSGCLIHRPLLVDSGCGRTGDARKSQEQPVELTALALD